MINLYLLKYNNYYNRKIKKEQTIQEYTNYVLASFNNIYTFDYADGINTSHVLPYKGETPDYAIVTEADDYGNEAIKSRWYVVESSYIRGGKYRVSLRRDLIADNLDEVLDAPCMVEKGYINDPLNDDGIFNDEGQSYNQIKVDETLLYDKSKCPWIVGYLANPTATQKRDANGNLQYDENGNPIMIPEDDTTVTANVVIAENSKKITKLSDIDFYNFFDMDSTGFRGTCKCGFDDYDRNNFGGSYLAIGGRPYENVTNNPAFMAYFDYKNYYGRDDNHLFAFGLGGKFNGLEHYWTRRTYKTDTSYYYSTYDENVVNQLSNIMRNPNGAVTAPDPIDIYKKSGKEISDCITYYGNKLTEELNVAPTIEFLNNYFQNRYYLLDGRTYKVELTFDEHIYSSNNVLQTYSDNIMKNLGDYFQYTSGQIANTSVSFTYIYKKVKVYIREVYTTIKAVIPKDRPQLLDAPYCMFCMPYGEINVYDSSATEADYTTNRYYSMSLATQISASMSSEKVYDLQIVPYCPITRILINGGVSTTNIRKTLITTASNSPTTVGFIAWCDYSSFSNDIYLDNPINIDNYKEESSLNIYRISDPSHTQVFEFNAAMNDGVDKFHVTCTYKPTNPYINIHPYFKRLYGKNAPSGNGDYDDTRGLTCGGDYSVPIVSNAWTEYEYRNKNYQNTFNREIQSMELSNKIQKKADIVNAVSTTINAGIQGSIGAGNILGATAAIPAGIGGAMDIKYKEMLRNDQVDKTKTLFNYNLQNIQALANTLNKSNPYNIDNKYVPYLEKYTCSDVEREAFKLKMKYDGMTIMRTGTLRYFLNYKDEVEESYIKGAIIRFPNLSEDYNYAKELSNEVGQGFYLDRRWY